MSKETIQKKDIGFTISQAIPQMGLSSREKFVCLRVLNLTEKRTLEDWEKLLKQKKIR